METTNGGITMKPNVSVQVARGQAGFSETNKKMVQEEAPENVKEVSVPEKPKKTEAVKEDKNISREVSRPAVVIFAERLAEKAKKDGVDAAFEELARSKEEEQEQLARNESKSRMDKRVDEINRRIEESLKKPEDDTKKNKEAVPNSDLMVQIRSLQQRVEVMAANNEEIMKKMAEMTEMNHKAVMTAIELAQRLQELIDEEEDKDKKSTLEVMLKMWAQILTYMMGGEKAVHEMEEREKEDKDKTPLEQMIAA